MLGITWIRLGIRLGRDIWLGRLGISIFGYIFGYISGYIWLYIWLYLVIYLVKYVRYQVRV